MANPISVAQVAAGTTPVYVEPVTVYGSDGRVVSIDGLSTLELQREMLLELRRIRRGLELLSDVDLQEVGE